MNSQELVQELIRATRQERERIEDSRNRSRYFIFGKISESFSQGRYSAVFANAPDRVVRDAEYNGSNGTEALFKIGDSFVEGMMELTRDKNIFVSVSDLFLRQQNLDRSLLAAYTDTGIDYVMDNRELVEYMIDFLETRGDRNNAILDELLTKEKKATMLPPIAHTHSLDGLNASQQEAIQKALQQKVTFIWGPPGTGKTKTLGALAAALVHAAKRVLLCGLSNAAVDQLLLSTLRRLGGKNISIARLGAHMDHLLAGFNKEAFRSGTFRGRKAGINWNDHAQNASVVAANFTYLSLPRLPWLGRFDYVIADEVSMANIPALGIASFFSTRAMVLGGDPHQLPPIFPEDAEEPNDWFKENIFHHADIGNVTAEDPRMSFLDTQYRMHPHIGTLVSTLFYAHKLKSADNPATVRHKWREHNVIFIHAPGAVEIVRDLTKLGSEERRINNPHALLILAEIADLLKREVAPADIGVIAPYNAQVANIAGLLRKHGIPKELRVSTVHSFQGQERRVIIVDFTDDNCDPTHLTAKRELVNVALSRPRELLIMVGNKDYLQNGKYFNDGERKLFSEMIAHAYVVKPNGKNFSGHPAPATQNPQHNIPTNLRM